MLCKENKISDKEYTNIKSYQKIATMTKANKDNISFFVFESKTKNIINKRVGYSDFIKKLSTKYEFDGAVVAIYHPDSDVWRLSFVSVEFTDNDKTKLQTTPKRYTFELGAVPHKTALEQLSILDKNSTKEDFLKAFSVEKLSKSFYTQLFTIFEKLVDTIDICKIKDSKLKQEFVVRLIGRVLFLKFLEKKGVVPSSKFEFTENYYHEVLEPLFFKILNTPTKDREEELKHDKDIPFLNGGLFEPQANDFYSSTHQHIHDLKVQDKYLKSLLELLDKYHFTIDENTTIDKDMGLDPELLGMVFENLIGYINPETNKSARKATGSYYTPREIVDYMVSSSIYEYLKDETAISPQTIHDMIYNDNVEQISFDDKLLILKALRNLKILDPAVGSGAFPMGVLNKIVKILDTIDIKAYEWMKLQSKEFQKKHSGKDPNYIRKLSIIQNTIYGIDIQPIAVEIAKLRFFLSLLVDENKDDIQPLPNLEFKIVCANSLLSLPKLDAIDTQGKSSLPMIDEFLKEFEKLASDYLYTSNPKQKQQIKDDIKQLIKTNRRDKLHLCYKDTIELATQIEASNQDKSKKSKKAVELYKAAENINDAIDIWKSYDNFFDSQKVDFFELEIFFPSAKDGFDIVIGNPPYIREKNIKELKNNIEQIHKTNKQNKTIAIYQNEKIYLSYNGTADIYVYFIEKGYQLLKKGGVLSYITSNKYTRVKYGKQLREFLLSNTNISRYIDFNGVKVFPNATVDTSILSFHKTKENKNTGIVKDIKNHNTFIYCNIDKTYKKGTELNQFISDNGFEYSQDDLSTDSFAFATSKELEIKNQIEKVGTPLKEWDINIYRGILTGYNEAFIIDTKTKDELIKQDKNSAEIIKPLLRGRDIKKYKFKFADKWIIIAKYKSNEYLEKKYTAVFRYLLQYQEKLSKRGQCNNRKGEGQHHWLELDNNPNDNYLNQFEKEKIVYSEIVQEPQFYLEESQYYIEATAFIMTGQNLKYLTALLNSKPVTFFFKKFYMGGGLGQKGYRYKKTFVERIPIPQITKEAQKPFEVLVDKIMNLKAQGKDTTKLENEIDAMVYQLYGLSSSEIDIVEGK